MRIGASRLVLGLTVIVVLAGAFGTIQFTQPAWYQRLWYPLRYDEFVTAHARNYRLDPALLAAVIYQESKFRAEARSNRGAIGLMQLLPGTAEGIAARTGGSAFTVADLYDPEINIRYGAWYLRHLLDKYGSERVALAAYNAGQAERRRVARPRRRDPVLRDAAFRPTGRGPQRGLPSRLCIVATSFRHLTSGKMMS